MRESDRSRALTWEARLFKRRKEGEPAVSGESIALNTYTAFALENLSLPCASRAPALRPTQSDV
jgi:hypothetical protein